MAQSLVIDLAVLELIKDLQSQHGLKYESYQRYRSYCSRRLHRIRRSLNVHQGVQASAKARHQRGRKLMDISNAMVVEAGEKNQEYGERMLVIPLFLAERAWSYAMQLKQDSADQPRKKYHLIRRLEKASQHAQRFEKLVHDPESPCTARTKEEATAYAAYITGLFKMEREVWDEAKDNLTKALNIYYKLSLSSRKDDVVEHYRQRIDELKAGLRYCAFNLGDKDNKVKIKVKLPAVLNFHDIAYRHAVKLEQELLQQQQQTARKIEEVARDVVKMDVDKPMASKSPAKKAEDKKSKTPVAAVAADDDDDDEFEETQDDAEAKPTESGEDEEEYEEDEDEESEEDDDDDDQQAPQTGVGKVTGLVKNLFGGWK